MYLNFLKVTDTKEKSRCICHIQKTDLVFTLFKVWKEFHVEVNSAVQH